MVYDIVSKQLVASIEPNKTIVKQLFGEITFSSKPFDDNLRRLPSALSASTTHSIS